MKRYRIIEMSPTRDVEFSVGDDAAEKDIEAAFLQAVIATLGEWKLVAEEITAVETEGGGE